MFASPLPPGHDFPSVSTQMLQRPEELNHPADETSKQTAPGRNIDNGTFQGSSVASVQRLRSLDWESQDLNLTASLEAFVAGIRGQDADESGGSVAPSRPEVGTGGAVSSVHSRGPGDQHVGTAAVVGTMEEDSRSTYMESAVGSVFPEAYANSYIMPKEGESGPMSATTSSYHVVLSDGTAYPSAVFPAVSSRDVGRSMPAQPLTSQVYTSQPRSGPEMSSYPSYVEAVHYSEPATTVPQPANGTSYYTSYYRRQFPASPIVADSAVAGEDGAPAVALPHDRDNMMETNRPGYEKHARSTISLDNADRDTITRLSEPMLLVDGVMGLPLKGQVPTDRGTCLLSSPMAHNREGRLLSAKKKLLSRPMQLIHVNRWDGKEVLTVDEGARRWLSELSTQYVAVISICGELQTGKSGLANLLLDDNVMSSSTGFAVGSSAAAPAMTQGSRFVQRSESEGKTEGVWMSAVEAEGDKDNLVFLILDYEGIGGAVDSDTLFSLASSSAWTQRLRTTPGGGMDRPITKAPTPSAGGPPTSPSTRGKPDATPLTSKPGSSSSSTSGCWRAPSLLWVLQDFNMSMVDEQQNPLTAGDYLEALFTLGISSDSRSSQSKLALGLEQPQIRMARQEASELFGDRDCVALPSPLGEYIASSQQASVGQPQPRALESVSVSEFVPLYQRRLTQLRCRVFRDCKGRAIDGTALTGIALTRILEKLVEGINGGEVPECLRLLGSIQHDECRRWKQVCEEAFTKELRETFQAKLPLPTKELQDGAERMQRKYSQHFKQHAIGDDEVLRHYKMQLKEKLRRITERAMEENDRHAEWKCRQKAKMLSDKLGIDQKISGKLYMDLQALNDDLALLRQEYNAEIRGPRHVHQRVLNEYLDQLLSKGAKAVADALKDLARDSERTAALLHQKTMDAERKGDKAVKLEQELQDKDYEAEQLRRELEDEREQQTLQEERHKQETKELRRELAEQRETNQRLSALYHSRIMDDDDGYRYGSRRSKHSMVGVNDQARCFGQKCTIM